MTGVAPDTSGPVQVRVPVPAAADGMPAYLWTPPGGSGPGILLLHEIFGVGDYIRRRAAQLAEAGYVVLAPELQWRLGPDVPPLDESAPGAIEAAMGRTSALDWETTVADAVAALTHLEQRDGVGATGVLGFCFGGGLGFNVAAVAPVHCLVSYYGSALPDLLDLAPRVDVPSLHHFGLADDYIDRASVERIRVAVTRDRAHVRFETYEGANHAFDNDRFVLHHPAASAAAWDRTLAFLAEQLPVR